MKTTFLPVLTLTLAVMLAPQANGASTEPALNDEGESLETAPAATLASAELQPGPAKVAGRNVNVRAKATIHSEVITQMQDGDEVFVEEVILRPGAKGDDPARWAKITYPSKAPAWVHSLYIDAQSSTVKPRKLNVRAGPGENYTIVGALRSGDTVAQLDTKGAWLMIQPPEGTTAYIAAKLLRQETPTPPEVAAVEPDVADTEVVETAVVDTEVVEAQPEVAEGGEPEVAATETASTEPAALEGATTIADAETGGATDLEPLPEPTPVLETLPEVAPVLEPVPAEPLPPRIVDREGIVRGYTPPHAPSHYKLVSADNGRLINYIYTTSTNLDLGRYVGLHIVATGEEALDERWATPVLTLKRIVVVDDEY